MEIILGKRYLVDTNVLVYGLDRSSKYYLQALNILQTGTQKGYSFVIAQQNLVELVTVLTKVYKVPKSKAVKDAAMYAYNFDIINPFSSTFLTFSKLIKRKSANAYTFDVYLIATMKDNNVHRIITADKNHFKGFGLKQIVVL